VVATFETYKVLTARELHARYEVLLETYTKTLHVEGQLMVLLADRYLLPAALEYQTAVATSVRAVTAAGGRSKAGQTLLARVTRLTDTFKRQTDTLAQALTHRGAAPAAHATYMRDTVVPAMAALRETGDALEGLVPHGAWPLPTYREMLFIK
jgi:glutamine synthetase